MLNYPSIGLIETNSISKGIKLTDYILKKAPVELLLSNSVCPGKYIVLFSGDEESCLESLKEAKEYTAGTLVDNLLIPNVHTKVINCIMGTSDVSKIDSLGIIETYSVASGIQASDIVVKTSEIDLIDIRLAMGIGGKSYFTFSGTQHDVEASIEEAKKYLSKEGLLCGCEIIPAPHEDMAGVIL